MRQESKNISVKTLVSLYQGCTHIHHAEVTHAADERSAIARERQGKAPEPDQSQYTWPVRLRSTAVTTSDLLPLEADDGHDCQALKDHGKSRLASSHAAIQQADAGYDKKHKTTKNDLVYIFELPSFVLLVDIDLLWVPTSWGT